MDKNYILEEIQCTIDTLTDLRSELTDSNWKFDTVKVADDIGCATNEGRGGLSILINSIPSMEYRLNKYRESGLDGEMSSVAVPELARNPAMTWLKSEPPAAA